MIDSLKLKARTVERQDLGPKLVERRKLKPIKPTYAFANTQIALVRAA